MAQNQLPANGTSDASGNLTVTFPAVNTNAEFSGVVSIPSAPATAQTSVIVNDQTVATIGGSSQYGTIQLSPQDVLVLEGTGFDADTQYQAICSGLLVAGTIGPQIPTPTVSAVQAALTGAIEALAPSPTPVFSGSVAIDNIGFGYQQVTVPTTARTLLISFPLQDTTDLTNVNVTGDASTYAYYNQPPYLRFYSNISHEVSYLIVVPISAIVDPVLDIYLTGTDSTSLEMNVYWDSLQYDESEFYNGPVSTSSTASGAAGTILLANGPFRLLAVSCVPSGSGNAAIVRSSGEALVNPFSSPATLSFDAPGLIIPTGDSVSFYNENGTYSSGSISYAYP